MEVSLIPVWITSSFSAAGVIYAIVRNGSRQKRQDEQLKTELKLELNNIKKKLDDPDNGLGVIKKSVDDQRLHCANISTRIESQVKTNSEEIINLRKRKKC